MDELVKNDDVKIRLKWYNILKTEKLNIIIKTSELTLEYNVLFNDLDFKLDSEYYTSDNYNDTNVSCEDYMFSLLKDKKIFFENVDIFLTLDFKTWKNS